MERYQLNEELTNQLVEEVEATLRKDSTSEITESSIRRVIGLITSVEQELERQVINPAAILVNVGLMTKESMLVILRALKVNLGGFPSPINTVSHLITIFTSEEI